jgi:uncharacterized protein (DUF2236 family)
MSFGRGRARITQLIVARVQEPLSLFIGGVTAITMELAEPCVRTGVWEHTSFRWLREIACRSDSAAARINSVQDKSTSASRRPRLPAF